MRIFCVIVILLFLFVFPAIAEYAVPDRPNFSVNTHGDASYQTWTVSGTVPLDFIQGYAGGEWVHFQSGESVANSDYIKARVEGGYHIGRLGFRGYVRYGERSIAAQDGLVHGGGYLHIDIIDEPTIKLNAGIGAWIAQEKFLDGYTLEPSVDVGPHLHSELQLPNISVLAECLPNHTLDAYTVRVIPIWEVPLFKVLFVEQVSLEISGEIEYKSSTHHVEIEPWQWHWKHALKFGF